MKIFVKFKKRRKWEGSLNGISRLCVPQKGLEPSHKLSEFTCLCYPVSWGESSFPLSGLVPEQMFYFKSVTFKSEEIAIPRSLLTTTPFLVKPHEEEGQNYSWFVCLVICVVPGVLSLFILTVILHEWPWLSLLCAWWRDGVTCSVSYIGFEMRELGWKSWLQNSRAFSPLLSNYVGAHGEWVLPRGMKIHQHIHLGKLTLRICFLTISSRRKAMLSPYPHFRTLLDDHL